MREEHPPGMSVRARTEAALASLVLASHATPRPLEAALAIGQMATSVCSLLCVPLVNDAGDHISYSGL